jgi:hypothetical protein
MAALLANTNFHHTGMGFSLGFPLDPVCFISVEHYDLSAWKKKKGSLWPFGANQCDSSFPPIVPVPSFKTIMYKQRIKQRIETA